MRRSSARGVRRGLRRGRQERSCSPDSPSATNRRHQRWAVWRATPISAATWATGRPEGDAVDEQAASRRGELRVTVQHGPPRNWCAVGRHTFSGRSTSITCRCHQSLCSVQLASLGRDEGPADDRRNGALPHAEEEIAVRAIEQGAGEGAHRGRSPPAAVPRERRARGSRSRRPARPLRAHPPRGRLSPGANRDRGSGASQGVESHAQVHEARSE